MAQVRMDEGARRELQRMIADSVQVRALTLDSWAKDDEPQAREGIIYVDASARTDIADFVRVHHQEPKRYEGKVTSRWALFMMGQEQIIAVLDIRVREPVVCNFCVSFDLADRGSFEFVAYIDWRHFCIVSTSEPGQEGRIGVWLQLGGQSLVEALEKTGLGELVTRMIERQHQQRAQ